jgi:hypothetical protein
MNKRNGEPGTIEYEEPHGSAKGLCEKLVLEARQMGMETGTLEDCQFSRINCAIIGHSSYQLGPPLGK